jgi:hypothetical protein
MVVVEIVSRLFFTPTFDGIRVGATSALPAVVQSRIRRRRRTESVARIEVAHRQVVRQARSK